MLIMLIMLIIIINISASFSGFCSLSWLLVVIFACAGNIYFWLFNCVVAASVISSIVVLVVLEVVESNSEFDVGGCSSVEAFAFYVDAVGGRW